MKYYNNKAVFVETKGYNCTYTEGPKAVQSRNGTELILVNEVLFTAQPSTDHINSTISVAVMKTSDFGTMKKLGKKVRVQLYEPPLAAVDTNLAVIWFLAVGTVVIGAYWSGNTASELRLKQEISLSSSDSEDEEAP
ncbi:signal peptide peptidase-like 2A [Xenia sp. Carnegie-2017]|uniref:signal peptide peptidase-like 2A n=1 Tax=Xenia sp. Carnegie-2017 TaxID=2897299 RepID=UPI001F035F0F|nr:signal peptide peptidase-like 2A [Xenia sp. Carnegie-2017]